MDIIHESQKKSTTSAMVNESDEDLLVIISMKDDVESSNLAFTEFHYRYKNFIYGMAVKITTYLPNSVELRDAVFQNTLINVYKYCSSFGVNGEKDPKKIKSRIHGWLIKIARRELLALLSNREAIIDPSELNLEYETDDLQEEDATILYSELMVNEALKILIERDQHIFMTYWLYYELGVGSQAKNLPPDILDDLATKYGTTPENIRQIISRSKRKVFDFLKANYKLNQK